MVSFTGLSGTDIVVDYVLSPSLWKVSSDGHETLVHKARVMTTQPVPDSDVDILPTAAPDLVEW